MLTLDAREAKQGFGRLLDAARRERVGINKHGRKVAVVMAAEDYDELEELEILRDIYWAKKAEAAAKGGFLGIRETAKILGIKYVSGKAVPARPKNSRKTATKSAGTNRTKTRGHRQRRKTLSRPKTA